MRESYGSVEERKSFIYYLEGSSFSVLSTFPSFLLSSSHPSNVTDGLTCNTTQDSVSIFIFVLEKANNALWRSQEENLFFPYSVAILLTEELLALK